MCYVIIACHTNNTTVTLDKRMTAADSKEKTRKKKELRKTETLTVHGQTYYAISCLLVCLICSLSLTLDKI